MTTASFHSWKKVQNSAYRYEPQKQSLAFIARDCFIKLKISNWRSTSEARLFPNPKSKIFLIQFLSRIFNFCPALLYFSGMKIDQKPENFGSLNPISSFIFEAYSIFSELGFIVAEGPQLETEHNNFDALNVPPDHPSRDMQDTFWIKDPIDDKSLLRSHTSTVQARYMVENEPPFRIISPGRVYRQEATDATHEVQFHQIEGLIVEKGINLGHLKGILEFFLQRVFKDENLSTRFRPGYFPFVEPGVEIDIPCTFCREDGCSVCKKTGWIEILGAGAVHPNVFSSAKVDPTNWRGIAFGLSPERILMLRHGVNDIRWFQSADLRFIKQF